MVSMSDSPIQLISKGISKEVHSPEFGRQHKGLAPGGPMDQFSYDVGNALLFNSPGSLALEFIIAPTIRFTKDCFIVIMGARYHKVILNKDGVSGPQKFFEHATVYFVNRGSTLEFADKTSIGFRSYLCYVNATDTSLSPEGRKRYSFESTYGWAGQNGKIRVIEGPEYDVLSNKEMFFETYWMITNDFSEMGFRLTSPEPLPQVDISSMISEAVADGTIQLTPKGPIVLLKKRQTVGGYPRIFNVISADVDQLGQYAPNQILQFMKVSIESALSIVKNKKESLQSLTE